MTQHFAQKDIDRLRECFHLYAPSGHLNSASQLRYIMRCLGYAATLSESNTYYEEQSKKSQIDFASFLDILYKHGIASNPHNEIIAALRAFDTSGKGVMPVDELTTILGSMGEKLQAHEVQQALSECNVSGNMVPFDKFVRALTSQTQMAYL